jgi:hypothetical protein
MLLDVSRAAHAPRGDKWEQQRTAPTSATSVPLLTLYPSSETCALTVVDCMPTPNKQCPVDGCGVWSSRWGKRSHPLPSAGSFTLLLNAQVNVSINNRICQPCWKRHSDHTISLDGRTRVLPPTSSSSLDALLSAISPIPLSSTASLPASFPPPTPARLITPILAHPVVSPVSSTELTSPRRTHSSPPVLDLSPAPSTFSERQRDVVASVMAGIDYERYRLQEVMKGGTPVSKDTWYAHQSTVYNSIIQIAESKEVEYLQMLKATGQRLVFCADAAWSHRGYEANQCCWLLLNAENKQVALAVVLTKSRWEKGEEVHKGNSKGSSGGMEGMAMERGIARLKENGLLPLVQGWVCDKDSSVSEQLKTNPDTAHIPIHYDPGHIKKNFQKSLMAIYGTGVRYKGLAERGGQRAEHMMTDC